MDMYEQLVETYLTVFEHLAVIPQFPVVFDDKGNPIFEETEAKVSGKKYPDFLALDIRKRQAQIVEVTKSAYPQAVKLAKRVLDNKKQIEKYVTWFAPEFRIQWRLFVRQKIAARFKSTLEAGGIQPEITTLE